LAPRWAGALRRVDLIPLQGGPPLMVQVKLCSLKNNKLFVILKTNFFVCVKEKDSYFSKAMMGFENEEQHLILGR